jgi:peroxin-14
VSPLENRIAFLQSKNLTQEEIDVALARTGSTGSSTPNYSNYGQQQVMRPPPADYGYQQYQWQQPPPELPRRDWRDWFIMATVMGGVSYGLYTVAKRYVVPLIAPPTPPQLEQDKQAIDESFEKAFALLDQVAKDTEALKASEQARTERLDAALLEVETVISELKTSSRRREEDSQRITDEVRGLKDLIPKAMEGQKESTDSRLRELNAELKSLKMLMGQRMNPPAAPPTSSSSSFARSLGTPSSTGSAPPSSAGPATGPASSSATETTAPKPATVSGASGAVEAAASLSSMRSASPFAATIPQGRSAIPAWQMAAANKSSSSTPPAESSSGAGAARGEPSSTSQD